MSEGSGLQFDLSQKSVPWESREWEVLLARVGTQTEEGSLPRQDCGCCVPSEPTVTPLFPFSLKELESQVSCLEKEATELKEAVEQQKVKNNVSIGRVYGGWGTTTLAASLHATALCCSLLKACCGVHPSPGAESP